MIPYSIRKFLNALIRRYFRYIDRSVLKEEYHPYYDSVASSTKSTFEQIYQKGIDTTGTPKSLWRRDRFLNLFSFALEAAKRGGAFAECGCWKGLSAYVIASANKQVNQEYLGEGFYIIDSFEGLSAPSKNETDIPFSTVGKFLEGEQKVKENLSVFSKIKFIKGWIPEVFKHLEEKKYVFVHVDVDLAHPTIESIKYFFPRLAPGGVIICDDYGGIIWKSMRQELDLLIKEQNIRTLFLSTGQLVMFKVS